MSQRLEKCSPDQLRLRDRLPQDVSWRTAEAIVQGEVINVAGIQRRRDHLTAQNEPKNSHGHRPEVPIAKFGESSGAFYDAMNRAVGREKQRHILLARENSDEPEPMSAN